MNKISELDDAALSWLLETLEKHPERSDQVKRAMHDLFVHQVELEQQNRELQATQEKLEESRDRYADLYDFAPVAYVTVDAKGSIQEINLAGAELLGKERQRLIGGSLAGFVEPGDRRVVLSFLRRLLETDKQCTEVISLTGADGRKSIVRVQGRTEPSDRLRYIALVDITAVRQAEYALAQSEDNFRVLADQSEDLICRHDATGVYLYVSPYCRRLLGYGPAELLGRSMYDFIHPDDLDAMRASFNAVVAAASTDVVRCRMRRRDGDYSWFELRSTGVKADPDGGDAVIITRSRGITDHEPPPGESLPS